MCYTLPAAFDTPSRELDSIGKTVEMLEGEDGAFELGMLIMMIYCRTAFYCPRGTANRNSRQG